MPIFHAPGASIYYEQHGQGFPLILIAGLTCDLSVWNSILPGLKEHFQVLVFDNRGVGRSDCPDTPYTIEIMARDTLALLDHLHLERCHILGHSMGGCIAQKLTLNHANRIFKLVLCNSLIKFNPVSTAVQSFFLHLRQEGISSRRYIEGVLPWIFSNDFLADKERVEQVIQLQLQNPYPQPLIGFKRQLEALFAFDSNDWFHKIRPATLIVCGEDDILCPRDSQRLAKGIMGAKLINFARMGHVPLLEKPEEFNQAIIEFLKSSS